MEGRSTRSRVTLPDDILQVGQASPLKKARSQRRDRTHTGSTTSSTDPTYTFNDQDGGEGSPRVDEDHSAEGKNGKRAASSQPSGESKLGEEGRESKRLKTDLSLDGSDMVKPQKESRFLARVKSINSHKPHSTGHKPTPPPPSPPIGRAASVPLFPSEYSLPHIDLRHPPPSPSRTRSRSPSKESTPKLQMNPLPKMAPSLESIPDEAEKMSVDPPSGGPIAERVPTPSQGTAPAETRPIAGQALGFVELVSPEVKFSTETTMKQLGTPVTDTHPLLSAEMSPLTPYPETPFQATQERLRAAAVEKVSKQKPIPKLAVGPAPPKASMRPSSSSNANSVPKILPNPTGKPTSRKAAPSDLKEKVKVNAFDRLMKRESKPGSSTAPKSSAALVKESSKGPPGRIKMGMKPKQHKESRKSTIPPPLVPLPDDAEDEMPQTLEGEASSRADIADGNQSADPHRLPIPDASNSGHEVPTGLEIGVGLGVKEPNFSIPEPSTTEDEAHRTSPRLDHPPAIEQVSEEALTIPQPPQPTVDQHPDLEVRQAQVITPTEPEHNSEGHAVEPQNDVEMAEAGAEVIEVAKPECEATAPGGTGAEAEAEVPESQTSEALEIGKGSRGPEKQTKLPAPRHPSVVASGSRLTRTTRSSSLKQVEKVTKVPESRRRAVSKPVSRAASRSRATSRAASAPPKEDQLESTSIEGGELAAPEGAFDFPRESEPTLDSMDVDSGGEGQGGLRNGPPTLAASPVRQSPRLKMAISSTSLKTKTPSGTPIKSRIPVKRPHSPSPAKLVRSASLFSRPPRPGSRLGDNSSALSSLSSALDKLRKPASSRPSTSMGFNADRSEEEIAGPSTQDDSTIGKRPGAALKGKPTAPLGKTSSFGPQHLTKGKFIFPVASGSKAMKQSTLLFKKPGAGHGKSLMGVGFTRAPKASRNPGLATVIGSPVKGGGQDTAMREPEEDMEPVPGVPSNGIEMSPFLDIVAPVEPSEKVKGKQRERDDFSTRRASTVSASLSESIIAFREENAKEKEKGKGNMGPPPLPERLSARSTGSSGSPGGAGETSSTPPGRRSTRTAAVAAVAANHALLTRKAPEIPKSPVNEALKFLKDCVIYVDVKTEDSEEAGSLFVDMLEGVGARTLKQVGQSCTHIVYKNGLQSTINKYNLLRDPKPLVVGIAWVVDCVEQRKRVEETEYLIDLDEVSLLTNPHKRRRSLLPKPISRQLSADASLFTESSSRDEPNDADVSMESSSSIGLDDLTPLERARRRKSMMTAN